MAKMLRHSNTEQYNEIRQGLGGFQDDPVSPNVDCAVARLLVLHQYGATSPRSVLGSDESLQLEGQFGRNDLRIDMPEPEWKNSIAVLRLGTLMKSSNRVNLGRNKLISWVRELGWIIQFLRNGVILPSGNGSLMSMWVEIRRNPAKYAI